MRRHEKTAYASYDDLDRAIDAGELTEPEVWGLLGYQEVAGVMTLPREAATRYTPSKPPAGAGRVGLALDLGLDDLLDTVIDTVTPPGDADLSLQDIWNLLDVALPEELLGLDITPGRQVGSEPTGRTYYNNVWIENGKVKTMRKGELRTLGYTPRFAKKKFRTRRRRKRLTKRDMYILEVLKTNPQAGALALML